MIPEAGRPGPGAEERRASLGRGPIEPAPACPGRRAHHGPDGSATEISFADGARSAEVRRSWPAPRRGRRRRSRIDAFRRRDRRGVPGEGGPGRPVIPPAARRGRRPLPAARRRGASRSGRGRQARLTPTSVRTAAAEIIRPSPARGIVSWHDRRRTRAPRPGRSLRRMPRSPAAAVKIVTTARDPADILEIRRL